MTLALLFLCSLEFRVLQTVDLCHLRESDRGRDVKSRPGVIGPKGERGQFQLRPIFIEDCRRLYGWSPDPDNVEDSQKATFLVLLHYARYSERTLGREISAEDVYKIFNQGIGRFLQLTRRRKR